MLIFKEQFCVSLSDETTVSKLKRKERLQNLPGVAINPKPPNCIWDKPNLFASTSLCSVSPQYAKYSLFLQSLVHADFFYFWDRLWYSDESVWKLLVYSLFGQLGICLIFIWSKNKGFESGVLCWKCCWLDDFRDLLQYIISIDIRFPNFFIKTSCEKT